MSPAGYWPQLHAAVDAGADSVYFGLKHFTARAKVGFELEELPEVMRTLHNRGVKGFVTFNSLIFDEELREAAGALAAIAKAGADAIIVQDLGAARLARLIAPELPIHGSTQMSITSVEGVRLAQEFGVTRVVLARELSLKEVRSIRSQTDCELEIFVHGALCVSYSGQCFSSEAWGGRSANRGKCAQACRLPYEMLVDGELKPLADARYLLSPGDLYTLRQIPEIVEAGVQSLKIEGRYKDETYVAMTTSAYRKAVDEAWAGLPLSVTDLDEIHLEEVYSRGMGPYFLSGTNHQQVVRGRTPRHRGARMGTVSRVEAPGVLINLAPAHHVSPLKPGDGVVFDSASWRSPQEDEEGGAIYAVTSVGKGQVRLEFANGAIQFNRIRQGDLLWRTADANLDKVVRALPTHKQPVSVKVRAYEGEPLLTEWQILNSGSSVTVASPDSLGKAQNRPIDVHLLKDQFGRLGNTPYELSEIELDLEGAPFVSSSALNQLRRIAVEQLQSLQGKPPAIHVNDPAQSLNAELAQIHPSGESVPVQIHLLVRTPRQLEAAILTRPASITLDYLDLFGLRPSVELVQSNGIEARVASPRVLKPGEERIVDFLLKLNCSIVVRSAGLLHSLRHGHHPELIGDFSLNAANVLTAHELLARGLTRITPTHDLNAAQIAALAAQIGPASIEVAAYQHLPIFYTEHCVFCRFLSTGTSYLDCGRPCDTHQVELRDENGRAHPVIADVGCRNTVFGAEAQEASSHLKNWLQSGIRHFRLEFAHETAKELTEVSNAFTEALHGSGDTVALARRLKRIAPQGITQGSLFVPVDSLIKSLQPTASGQINGETSQPVAAGIMLSSHRQ